MKIWEKRFIAAVDTEGTHDILIYNPGAFGNDRKMTVESEFWWSPQLGLNLLSIKTDHASGNRHLPLQTSCRATPTRRYFNCLPDSRLWTAGKPGCHRSARRKFSAIS
jgi:hypothetical protein